MIGAVLILGLVGILQRPDRAGPVGPAVVIAVDLVLGGGCLLGGAHLYKRAGVAEGAVKRLLAMSPLIVFVVLLVLAGIGAITQSPGRSGRTDAYGYTADERNAFVNACGRGRECTCSWRRLEAMLTPDEMREGLREYQSTGSYGQQVVEAMRSAVAACR
jgi:hypothetical protein